MGFSGHHDVLFVRWPAAVWPAWPCWMEVELCTAKHQLTPATPATPRAKSYSSEVTDWISDGQSSAWTRLLPFTRLAGRLARSRRWADASFLPKKTSATIFISYMWACKSHAD